MKLDNVAKLKMATPPRIRLIDIAMGATGKAPTSLSMSDDTIKVAMAYIKILQSLGVEQNSNVVGDIQPTEITKEPASTIYEYWFDTEPTDKKLYSLFSTSTSLRNQMP